ncbi:MAG: molybdopterin molybdotransferase MoeA [Bacillota bacterium]
MDLNLEEARDLILNSILTPLAGEPVPLHQALDRIAASDLYSPLDLPSYPLSAVDGYAIHEDDLNLKYSFSIMDCPSGRDLHNTSLNPGQTAKVLTGGPLPLGAGAVIPYEQTRIEGNSLFYQAEIARGVNIRRPGEDFQYGDLVVRRGDRISPGLIGILAALGKSEVMVYRRPGVMILSLGEEVVPCHAVPAPGQFRDCNGPLLASMAASDGARVDGVEIAGCTGDSPRDILKKMVQRADIILTIGRTASGEDDYGFSLLRECGARVLFRGVGIKPGNHSSAAICEGKPVISLSGNPAACAVGYQLLAAPVILGFQGLNPYPRYVSAQLNDPFPQKGGPRRFLRGFVSCGRNGWEVNLLPGQKSSMLRSLIKWNSLIDLPASHPQPEAGAEVSVMLLSSAFKE